MLMQIHKSGMMKVIEIKITGKFLDSRRLRFEDRKRIMSSEIRPKSFGAFEKKAPEKFSGLRETGLWTAVGMLRRKMNTVLSSTEMKPGKLSKVY